MYENCPRVGHVVQPINRSLVTKSSQMQISLGLDANHPRGYPLPKQKTPILKSPSYPAWKFIRRVYHSHHSNSNNQSSTSSTRRPRGYPLPYPKKLVRATEEIWNRQVIAPKEVHAFCVRRYAKHPTYNINDHALTVTIIIIMSVHTTLAGIVFYVRLCKTYANSTPRRYANWY